MDFRFINSKDSEFRVVKLENGIKISETQRFLEKSIRGFSNFLQANGNMKFFNFLSNAFLIGFGIMQNKTIL